MKRKSIKRSDFAEKFRKEKLDDHKLNFLLGGDEHGSEPPDDPWNP